MRVALGIEYDGSDYYGWQRQKEVDTAQSRLEHALSKIACQPIAVQCAGRTDAGVHATGQVVHFDSPVERPVRAWTLGANGNLPDNIAVKWAKTVSEDFHARFSATARRYRYIIYNNPMRMGIFSKGLTHIYGKLDHHKMHEAAQVLVGEHDFSAFRASNCQAHSPVRNMTHIDVSRRGDYVIIEVQANAFLHHMVRNITGSLILVGNGERDKNWFARILQDRDRTVAGMTARPNGLYLVNVSYPAHFELPTIPDGPIFF